MKPKLSALVVVGLLIALSLPMLPLNQVAAQDDPRGMGLQQGERRVALVIGNSAYKDSPLLNPVNDARAMAQALREFGFEVVYGEDLSQNDMKRNIRAFGEKIRNGGVGLFYYAGHGVQIRGSNYLIPVGATITSEEEVEYESVDVGLVLAQMETARNRLNIAILDACRDNPFARSFRSTQRGLVRIDAPSGTLIAYATAPGSVASDGTGRNGLYTQQLLKQMRVPNLSIEQVFKQVRIAVRDLTQGKQIPWESSSLVGDFYFSTPTTVANTAKNTPPPSFDPATIELSFWESIKNSSDVDDYKEYLAKYPTGTFAGLARNKIKNLEAAAKPNSSTVGSPLPLRGFDFDTVILDSKGSVTSRRKVQAQHFTENINGIPLEMVEIPGGTFLMGSPISEAIRFNDEGPQHTVTVQTFYMGKYEVTQAQWRAVARLPKVKRDLKADRSYFKSDDLPVESISWEDAVEFCERFSKATGREYRLPSEAEWEYACRAGTTTPFAFGNTITPELVNYNGDYPDAQASKGVNRGRTMPVGYMGIANAFGLFDMHGNVWEWCQDAWHARYENAPADGSAWERADDPKKRVLRGGSWRSHIINNRAAYRLGNPLSLRYNFIGFRVALSAPTR